MVKGSNKKIFFGLLASSFLIYTSISIYTEEPVQLTSRKVLLFFEADKRGKWIEEDLLLLYDSLLIKLAQESKAAVFYETPAFTVPAADTEKSELAVNAGCDAWLAVSLLPVPAEVTRPPLSTAEENEADRRTVMKPPPPFHILVRSYDILHNQEVIRLERKKADFKELERLFWGELVRVLNRYYKKISRDPAAKAISRPLSGSCAVTIKAAAGTIITGLRQEELVVGENGELSLALARNRTYTLQATCRNYFPLTETLYPKAATLTHTLKQQRSIRWALALTLHNLNYPGLEGSFYLSPHTWYLRAGVKAFFAGLPEWTTTEHTAEPLTDFSLSTGRYFLKPDNLFRFYASLGVFLRIVTRSQTFLLETNDLALLYGLFPTTGMEFSPYTRFRCFVEYLPLFYLHPSFALKRLVVEPFAFNLGIRAIF